MRTIRFLLWTVPASIALAVQLPSTARADTPREIARRVSPSVVLLVMEEADGTPLGLGSGFVVREGVVATSLHVIDGAVRGHARLADAETRYDVRGIVASDAKRDLVLLSVDGLKAEPLEIGDSEKVAVGDAVYAVGSPRGLAGTFSAGIVSSIRKFDGHTLVQITTPISPGSSGGPVVNGKGEVIGVTMATLKHSQNLNFAVPSEFLAELLERAGKVTPLVPREAKDGVEANPAQEEWWKAFAEIQHKAADRGDTDAMVVLGCLYTEGLGVAQDHREAVKWFHLAAERQDGGAMAFLAAMYNDGRGVQQSYSEAAKWFRRAAGAGHAVSMVFLGMMYSEGRGVPQDDREAVRCYRNAAESGLSEAMLVLGGMYYQGKGVSQDDREAVRWFRQAADLGHAGAMFNLGVAYSMGRGVPQDDRAALQWFRQAAERGDATAAVFNLGVMYATGQGVAEDDVEAVKWFHRAADQGYADAMGKLGTAYALGQGVPQNYVESYVWFSLAAALGDEQASEYRDLVAEELTAEVRLSAQQRARVLFERISAISNE